MKKQLFLGLVATAVVSGASAVEITKEWKIVVPRHEAGVVRFGYEKASQALQKDLAEGAGLKLEIVRTPPNDGPAIHLGADAAKAAGVRTDDLVWFDNAIVEKDGNLYLFGNDRPRRIDSKPWEWFRAVLPTVGATVRFLHDYLGNRYCAPGETGRHVGHKDKVVVPDGATWLCVCNLDEKAGATASLKVGTKAFRTELPPLGVVFKNVK